MLIIIIPLVDLAELPHSRPLVRLAARLTLTGIQLVAECARLAWVQLRM